MSDKEKSLVDQIAELPAEVQDRFLLMAQGAAVALDSIRAAGDPSSAPCGGTFPQGKADEEESA